MAGNEEVFLEVMHALNNQSVRPKQLAIGGAQSLPPRQQIEALENAVIQINRLYRENLLRLLTLPYSRATQNLDQQWRSSL